MVHYELLDIYQREVLHKHSWPQNSENGDIDDSKIQLGIRYTSIESNKLCLRVEFRSDKIYLDT